MGLLGERISVCAKIVAHRLAPTRGVDRNMVYADGAIKLANVEGPNGLICQ